MSEDRFNKLREFDKVDWPDGTHIRTRIGDMIIPDIRYDGIVIMTGETHSTFLKRIRNKGFKEIVQFLAKRDPKWELFKAIDLTGKAQRYEEYGWPKVRGYFYASIDGLYDTYAQSFIKTAHSVGSIIYPMDDPHFGKEAHWLVAYRSDDKVESWAVIDSHGRESVCLSGEKPYKLDRHRLILLKVDWPSELKKQIDAIRSSE
ncbi:hypothetical protein MYX07_02010 [Patescibacteria group bacterium AH-259-L07]|nr:hypothetical protein [Patescibacteria group bacterium AH-259-L07]